MQLSRGVGRLLVVGILAIAPLLAPPGAVASCLAPPAGGVPWASADTVFVGTVIGLANNDRWATVRVEEVWQGPDQPAEVVVRGGPAGDAATSVDRTFSLGTRYIFAVTVDGGTLLDSSCSGTTEAGAIDLDAVRPVEVRRPIGASALGDTGIDLGGLTGPLAVAAIVGGLLAATVFLARHREA